MVLSKRKKAARMARNRALNNFFYRRKDHWRMLISTVSKDVKCCVCAKEFIMDPTKTEEEAKVLVNQKTNLAKTFGRILTLNQVGVSVPNVIMSQLIVQSNYCKDCVVELHNIMELFISIDRTNQTLNMIRVKVIEQLKENCMKSEGDGEVLSDAVVVGGHNIKEESVTLAAYQKLRFDILQCVGSQEKDPESKIIPSESRKNDKIHRRSCGTQTTGMREYVKGKRPYNRKTTKKKRMNNALKISGTAIEEEREPEIEYENEIAVGNHFMNYLTDTNFATVEEEQDPLALNTKQTYQYQDVQSYESKGFYKRKTTNSYNSTPLKSTRKQKLCPVPDANAALDFVELPPPALEFEIKPEVHLFEVKLKEDQLNNQKNDDTSESTETSATEIFVDQESKRQKEISRSSTAVELPFICDEFGNSFESKARLSVHMRRMHNNNPTRGYCQPNPNGKTIPNLMRRRVNILNVARLKCDDCGKLFTTSDLLSNHKRNMHKNPRRGFCEQCGKATANLKRHELTFHQTDHTCDVCNAKFTEFIEYNYHRTTHPELNLPPVKCDECGKILINNKGLKVHLKFYHLRDYPYICELCGYGARWKFELDRHIQNNHTEIAEFICDICNVGFKTKYNLNLHKKRHKNNTPRKHKCQSCSKTFAQLCKLRDHEEAVHGGELKYTCEHCGKAFPIKNYLYIHLRSHETPEQKEARRLKAAKKADERKRAALEGKEILVPKGRPRIRPIKPSKSKSKITTKIPAPADNAEINSTLISGPTNSHSPAK